eukprot:gene4117-4030_t
MQFKLRLKGRLGFFGLVFLYALIVFGCVYSLATAGDLSMGRNPVANFIKTATEFARPSFLDVWLGDPAYQYKSDDGTVLRTENRQEVEQQWLVQLGFATWTTFKIATLGSLLGAILALPFGVLSAKNIKAPRLLTALSRLVLDTSRSIHTLVFGLVLVGIVGLGPTAGILAIAFHSLGTYGKLFAESIETLDMASIEAVKGVGASPSQTFFWSVWPNVLPQWVSSHLYLWEYNIRDSTILGIIGAGGLGLLISEAVALFQWGRLSSILIVVVSNIIDIQNLEMVIAGRRILKHTVFPLRRERDLRPVRAQVGQVLQGLHLVARLSAMENVLVGGLARMPRLRSWARIFTTEETQRAQAALKAVGMAHLAEKRADKLSGGERQKVAIARMLMQQPELVLADEPTAALDPTAADEVCELLVKATENSTLITVLHNVSLVPMLSHRVIGLKAGEVVLDCDSHELTQAQLDHLYE